MDWEVGQTIYIVPSDSRVQPREAVITKIERKWMTVSPEWLGPVSREDGAVKPPAGHFPSAYAWPSREAYEESVRLDNLWGVIQKRITWSLRPKHLSRAELKLIIDMVRDDA